MKNRDQAYEKIVHEIRELRNERDTSEALLFARIMQAEQTDEEYETIMKSGYESFEDFVRQWVKVYRYTAFKAGVAKIGLDKAIKLGAPATMEAGKLSNGSKEYVKSCENWSSEYEGIRPSKEASERIRRQVDPQKTEPEVNRRASRSAKLEAENKHLRAEVRSLQSKLKKAESRVEKLEKQLSNCRERLKKKSSRAR